MLLQKREIGIHIARPHAMADVVVQVVTDVTEYRSAGRPRGGAQSLFAQQSVHRTGCHRDQEFAFEIARAAGSLSSDPMSVAEVL
jgi:hypothetical protein